MALPTESAGSRNRETKPFGLYSYLPTILRLNELELTPSGLGLHFPTLDVDLSIPALFHQQTGSKQWMASQLGKAGGSVVSQRKAEAARENGKRGGRPSAARP